MQPHTAFTKLVGCRWPVQQAPMGRVSGVRLACAVAQAGGLGMLSGEGLTARALEAKLTRARQATTGAVGVNFLVPFLNDRECVVVAAGSARVVEFFWGWPEVGLVELVHQAGALTFWQVGSADEAVAAEAAGCDAIIAQGVEAGGHIRGCSRRSPFLKEVIGRVNIPVLAAGGIGTGRHVDAALRLGAAGVRVGTRFVAAVESDAHPIYVAALLAARGKDTEITETFSANWPGAPHRVLKSCVEAVRQASEEVIAHVVEDGMSTPVPRCSGMEPTTATQGNICAMALYAGESVTHVVRRSQAAEILEELMSVSTPNH